MNSKSYSVIKKEVKFCGKNVSGTRNHAAHTGLQQGARSGAGIKAGEAPKHGRENAGLLQIQIMVEEDAPDAPFRATSKVLNNQSTEGRTRILGPKL